MGNVQDATAQFCAALQMDPENFDAASALRAIYLDAQDHENLLSCLDVLIEYAPDRESRLALLKEMESVAERVSEASLFHVRLSLFQADPSDEALHHDLNIKAKELGQDEAWAETLIWAAQSLGPAKSAKLWSDAGIVLQQRLHRLADARIAHERALELEPNCEAAAIELARIESQAQDQDARKEQLSSKLEAASENSERAEYLNQLGAVCMEQSSDAQQAIAFFTESLACEYPPARDVALGRLQFLYRRDQDWSNLAEILSLRQEHAIDPVRKASLQLERGLILFEHLKNNEKAVDCLLNALCCFPREEAALSALYEIALEGERSQDIAVRLETVFARRADYERQVQLLSLLVGKESDDIQRANLAHRCGRMLARQLEQYGPALDMMARALASNPGDDLILSEFESIAIKAALFSEADTQIEEILNGETEFPPETRARLLVVQGRLRSRFDGDESTVIEAFGRALKSDAHNAQALHGLCKVALSGETDLLQVLAELLKSLSDDEVPIMLLCKVA